MQNSERVEIQQQFQIIQEQPRISGLLKQCVNHNTPVHVSLSRSSELFTCDIEKVDGITGTISISELRPRRGQKKLSHSKSIQIFTQVNGAEVTFETKVIRAKTAMFRTRNCLALPESIKYCQRRRAHRVHISLSLGVSASLQKENENKVMLRGQLRDISAEGMRVQFQRLAPQQFDELDAVSECIIALPDQTDIHCQFEIRHLHRHATNRGCDIGGSFVQLDNSQRRSIEKFIASVERRSLRESLL